VCYGFRDQEGSSEAGSQEGKAVEAVKPTKPVAPIPPPSCEASDITATSNDASNKVFCTGAGVAKINRVVTTCDTCKPAIEDRTIVGPKTGALIYQVM